MKLLVILALLITYLFSEKLLASEVIHIGMVDSQPWSYLDEQNKPAGIYPELFNLINLSLPDDKIVAPKILPLKRILKEMEGDRSTLAFAIMSFKPKRAESMRPLVPLYKTPFVLVSRVENPIKSLEEIKNKDIAVLLGGSECPCLGGVYTLFTSQIKSTAKEEILWVKWTLSPEYIDSGESQGKGYLDQFLIYVQSQLDEYTHRSEFQTPNRISYSWDKGNVCTVHLWLGYWPDKIVYSKPYAFTPRFGIVTKKESALAREFPNNESLSLKYLLENTHYRLGMLPLYYSGTKDARYPLMAPLIDPFLGTGKVHEFRNNRNEMNTSYLEKGRVDYYIRQRITHYSELKIQNKSDNYKFYFLDEGYRHKLTAAACSNSKLGKAVINKINNLINEAFYMKYLNFRREWDKDNHSFDQTFLDYFIKGIKRKVVTE